VQTLNTDMARLLPLRRPATQTISPGSRSRPVSSLKVSRSAAVNSSPTAAMSNARELDQLFARQRVAEPRRIGQGLPQVNKGLHLDGPACPSDRRWCAPRSRTERAEPSRVRAAPRGSAAVARRARSSRMIERLSQEGAAEVPALLRFNDRPACQRDHLALDRR
jgi:hypothetical protein